EQRADGSSDSITALEARPLSSPNFDASQLENRISQLEEGHSTLDTSIREIESKHNDFKGASETQSAANKNAFGALKQLINELGQKLNQRLDQAANNCAAENSTILDQSRHMLDDLRNEVF